MREDGQPTIGLAIIARDEEASLPTLLDSLGFPGDEAAVDHVVVCDTGSKDGTREVARERGCVVVEFEWCDDFSAARQASYDALPQVDFTLWADCDDVLEDAHKLREIAARLPPQIAGTIHRYNYAQDEHGNCICELWRERLVRPQAIAGWELPIHEVLKVEGELLHVDEVTWTHQLTPERVEGRDPKRNYKILQRDYERSLERDERPNTRTLAYLGTEALALGEAGEAAERFREYLKRPDARWDEERCQVAHKLSIALRQGSDDELNASADAGFQAIHERPDWADGYMDLAEISLRRSQPQRALYFCDTALRLEPPRTLLIINPMEYSYQPRLMRSVALAQMGRLEEAWEDTQAALAVTPGRQDIQAQAATIQAELQRAEAEKHLLALREVLVRHDENAKARALMDCAPYIVWDRPAVAQARLDQREMTLHLTDPEVYARYYQANPSEAEFEAHGVKAEEAHNYFHRLAFLREGIERQVAA